MAQLLETKIKDPRLGFVTVTDARVTGDLQNASIFYTVLGDEDERAATAAALESAKGVIRGIHYSNSVYGQSKIVTCTSGSILDVVVDLRRQSSTFGKSVSIELSEESGMSVYISSGLGHGFQALEDKSAVTYLLNKKYDSRSEFAIYPLDHELGIEWRQIPVVISEKDKLALSFKTLRMANDHV